MTGAAEEDTRLEVLLDGGKALKETGARLELKVLTEDEVAAETELILIEDEITGVELDNRAEELGVATTTHSRS